VIARFTLTTNGEAKPGQENRGARSLFPKGGVSRSIQGRFRLCSRP
jgi:hypothetical protein